jgi:uncharacterized membrane protein YbhN (UPF0104 family)
MKAKSILWTMGSVAVSVALIVLLIHVAKISPRATVHQLAGARRGPLLRLLLLMTLHVFLSAEKWRSMDRVIHRPGDVPLTRSVAFAVTSGGVALGQILPMQLSMVVARVLGTQLHGRAFTRGTVGTIFDQGSDFLLVCFLIPASALTWLLAFGPAAWLGLAVVMAVLAVLTVDPTVQLVRRVAAYSIRRNSTPPNRIQRALEELAASPLLASPVLRRLLLLSIVRFVVLVLMAGETSRAIGSSVPLWHLGAAMPFVVLSSALAITPGGIGLNELTYATALSLFGTPLSVGVPWALANRILVAATAFTLGACTAAACLVAKSRSLWFRRTRGLNRIVPSAKIRKESFL